MDSHVFDIKFDEGKLLSDLHICQNREWPVHFNQNDYTGKWSSLALRSISGSETDISATANAAYQNTALLDKCGYFQKVIDWFACPKEAVRLLSLAPDSYIREHKDQSTSYKDGFFRIHVPIQTNDAVVFRVNGKDLGMKPGSCWYANFNLPHFVSNQGSTDRIHLVIDCIRNEWSETLFASAGYDFENEHRIIYEDTTKLAMIEQLTAMKTHTADALIAQLRAELTS